MPYTSFTGAKLYIYLFDLYASTKIFLSLKLHNYII
nr:MAG TPA: hypothetical protein [Bacteriophage sp.]